MEYEAFEILGGGGEASQDCYVGELFVSYACDHLYCDQFIHMLLVFVSRINRNGLN
jgi:hypothetical protein